MRALFGQPARAVAIAAVVVVGVLALTSCGERSRVAEVAQAETSAVGDATDPDPGVPTPDSAELIPEPAPDVAVPDVTDPEPAVDPVPDDGPVDLESGNGLNDGDDGLGLLGIGLLVLMAIVIVAAVLALVTGGGRSTSTTNGQAQRRRRLYVNIDRLIDDCNWAIRQAFEATRSTDLDRVAAAWPNARDHFVDIEREAADIHPDSSGLTDAVQQVGLAVAELRGSLDAYVAAIRRGSLGQLDALGSLQARVTGRQDNLAVQLQALASVSNVEN